MNRNAKIRLLLCAALFGLTACSSKSTSSSNLLEAEGARLVAENCLTCHSLTSSEDAPRVDAPALSLVLKNYNKESLTDDFREGIHVGHPDMPDFDFGPKGTDALIAYLSSIEEQD